MRSGGIGKPNMINSIGIGKKMSSSIEHESFHRYSNMYSYFWGGSVLNCKKSDYWSLHSLRWLKTDNKIRLRCWRSLIITHFMKNISKNTPSLMFHLQFNISMNGIRENTTVEILDFRHLIILECKKIISFASD